MSHDGGPVSQPVSHIVSRQDTTIRWISGVLKLGSYGSALLMLMGVLLALGRPSRPASYPLEDLASHLLRLDATAVMQAGIILLLLTPVIRILVAILCFAREGDYRYAWISSGVLLIVISSVLFRVLL